MGLGGRGVKALCGRATSWGQSSAEGTPTTLQDDNGHQCTTVVIIIIISLNHKEKQSSKSKPLVSFPVRLLESNRGIQNGTNDVNHSRAV